MIYAPSGPRGSPDFQAHHHPFNYYAAFDPATHAAARAAHLKDYTDLLADIANGTVPPVAWYKPTGNVNQHPGYANLDDGDAHIADLVAKLQAGPQWEHMVIIITYDEYGGQWDHAAVPKGDLLGPGERIPAIIISPYAKKGTVDHTQYDTGVDAAPHHQALRAHDAAGPHGARHGAGQQRRQGDGRSDERPDAPVSDATACRLLDSVASLDGGGYFFVRSASVSVFRKAMTSAISLLAQRRRARRACRRTGDRC